MQGHTYDKSHESDAAGDSYDGDDDDHDDDDDDDDDNDDDDDDDDDDARDDEDDHHQRHHRTPTTDPTSGKDGNPTHASRAPTHAGRSIQRQKPQGTRRRTRPKLPRTLPGSALPPRCLGD